MNIIIGLLAVTALLASYVVWIRPWMRERPWAQGYFAWIEPIEIVLWRKSETILWARFKMVVGVVCTVLLQVGALDLSPLTPLIPPEYQWIPAMLPLILTLVGWVDEQLRKDTTKPLELVEIANKDMTPKVEQAIEVAEEAKVEAVAAVKVAEVEKVVDDIKAKAADKVAEVEKAADDAKATPGKDR